MMTPTRWHLIDATSMLENDWNSNPDSARHHRAELIAECTELRAQLNDRSRRRRQPRNVTDVQLPAE